MKPEPGAAHAAGCSRATAALIRAVGMPKRRKKSLERVVRGAAAARATGVSAPFCTTSTFTTAGPDLLHQRREIRQGIDEGADSGTGTVRYRGSRGRGGGTAAWALESPEQARQRDGENEDRDGPAGRARKGHASLRLERARQGQRGG